MSHLVEVKNLRISYGKPPVASEVIRDVSLFVNAGEITALMGETGSGKSTIGKSMLRLLEGDGHIISGQVLLQGKDIISLPEKDFARLRGRLITTVAQNPYLALNPVMRCGAQVAEVLSLRENVRKSHAKDRVITLFREVDLDDPERIYRSYPHEASIGEVQRVCIAMALAASPQLLIADEPFSSVDPVNRRLLAKLFRRAANERGIGLLIITHKIEMVDLLADHWYLLHKGRIVENGDGSFSSAELKVPYAQKLAADHAALKKILGKDKNNENPLFQVNDLRVDFSSYSLLGFNKSSTKAALQGVSFEIGKGETLGIVGRSGSGKSTLAKVLGGLYMAYSGNALLRSIEIREWMRSDRRSYFRNVQYLMQDAGSSLPPRRKVGQVLVDTLNAFQPAGKSVQLKKALELFASVELGPDVFPRRRSELSGGEQQRVSIARALAAQPQVLILDESLNSLDKAVQRQILELLKDIQSKYELTIIIISHDINLISHLCHRIIVLHQGEIAELGPTSTVLRAPSAAITAELLKAQG